MRHTHSPQQDTISLRSKLSEMTQMYHLIIFTINHEKLEQLKDFREAHKTDKTNGNSNLYIGPNDT